MRFLVISRSDIIRRYFLSYDGGGEEIEFFVSATVNEAGQEDNFDAVLVDVRSFSPSLLYQTIIKLKFKHCFLMGVSPRQAEFLSPYPLHVEGMFEDHLPVAKIIEHFLKKWRSSTAPKAYVPDVPLLSVEGVLLEYLKAGATDKEIARDLDLCLSTVKYYLRRLYAKLEIKNRTQAALIADKIIV